MSKGSAWLNFLDKVKRARSELDLDRDEECFFRGQGDAEWPLLPTLLRYCRRARLTSADAIRDLESTLFFEFRARARELHGLELTDWDVLFFMRHHGVATRLLDWTEVLGVALYFALADATETSRPCVWLLNPYALNEDSWEVRDLVAPEYLPQGDYSYAEYLIDCDTDPGFDWDEPVALYPEHKSARLQAQRGYFTIHGEDTRPLEDICSGVVRKVILPREAIPAALSFLETAGIDEHVLFPDLDALARHLHRKYLSK